LAAQAAIMREVVCDGRSWRLGTAAEVEWINAGTPTGLTVTSAIPPVFDDYATVVIPRHEESGQPRHDQAVITVLKSHALDQKWWLGYLQRGVSDVIFPYAPTVSLYSRWSYVLVQAGPEQAANWRQSDEKPLTPYRIPDLMFPADRSWLVSTLWDDDWTCIGGAMSLVDSFLNHPDLQSRTRRVGLDGDATPPGHQAI
jgi:hypothetical protein